MSAKFPIADQIRHGTPVETPSWWPEGDEFAHAIDWYGLCAHPQMTLFDITVASELYWLGRKSYYDLEQDFGPLAPPFPAMWFEWTIPQGAIMTEDGAGDEKAEFLIGTRHAVMLYTQDFHPYFDDSEVPTRNAELMKMVADGKTVMCGHLLTQVPGDDRIIYVPIATIIAVDAETGRFIPGTHQCAGYKPSMAVLADYLPEDVFNSIAKMDLNPVWLALNLMNCRNVTTETRAPAFARSGREKRQRQPAVRYHVIQLPGMSRRGSPGQRQRHDEAVMAMHRVRGHFKTYTAEAPLMGKHVGTYWWGWQVRGSKDRGEVIADYQMKGA